MKSSTLRICIIAISIIAVAFTQQENSLSKGAAKVPQTNQPKAAIIEMLAVEGGTFTMGDTWNEGNPDEKPTHTVTLSSFRIAKTEVTQKQWTTVMGTNPSKLAGENKPVETVSWYNATVFCNKLSIREGLTPCYAINGITNPGSWGECPYEIPNTSKIIGDSARWNNLTCDWTANGYRLPTEAEWEFAAGGGASHTRYAGTSDRNKLEDYAWTTDNSQQTTHDVAGKLPNSFGTFDMTGNVHEWCWDWYGPYTSEPKINPKGVKRSSNRTDHGGCWKSFPLPANNVVRVSYRNFRNPGHLTYAIGFRVAQNKQH